MVSVLILNTLLVSNKDTELFEAFEQLERERIGVGKHDEFHALLDQLQNTYLSKRKTILHQGLRGQGRNHNL